MANSTPSANAAQRSEDLGVKRAELEREMRDIHRKAGDHALSAGQQERWDRLGAGVENIDEEQRQLVRELASRPGHTEDGDGATGAPGTPERSAERGEYGRARQAIDGAARSGLLPDHAAQRATSLVEQGPAPHRGLAARWATATGEPAYLRAFGKLLADPVRGHLMWSAEEQDAYRRVAEVQAEQRAMSTTDAAGGFMVPLTLDPSIMLTSAGSINPLRRISRTVQTVTDSWLGISSAGATAEWKTEAAEVTDASPTLGDESIPVHFGDAFVPYSFEIGMDAVDFVGELQQVLVDAADQLQATAFTTGTGSGQPTGVITALSGGASEIDTATSGAFTAPDVYTIQNALPARFSGNAQWTAHIAALNAIAQFETTNGARLFPESTTTPPTLLRKPLNELSNMSSSLTASGEKILLYGDFQAGFVIVDRIGTQLELVPQLFGTANNLPTGQRGALLWFRTGSDVVVPNAFRLLNVAA